MAVTIEDLKAERIRLQELREKAWADVNQIIGAERMIERLIEQWDAKEG